ncbi:uncharacterized protein V6R79_024818 [Siganus canaliculatus]
MPPFTRVLATFPDVNPSALKLGRSAGFQLHLEPVHAICTAHISPSFLTIPITLRRTLARSFRMTDKRSALRRRFLPRVGFIGGMLLVLALTSLQMLGPAQLWDGSRHLFQERLDVAGAAGSAPRSTVPPLHALIQSSSIHLSCCPFFMFAPS